MRKIWVIAFAAAMAAGVTLPAQGQGPVLVRDIATGLAHSPDSYASPPVRFRGEDYFSAADGFLGHELWATNGTLRGTRLVADLCPGRCSGKPEVLTASGDLLFFIAGTTTYGYDSSWLWRSDGTAAGTFPLVDFEIGGFGAAFPASFFAPFRGGVTFIVYDRARRGWALWGSDGTRAGTRRIAPLPGRFDPSDAPRNYDWPLAGVDPRRHYFTWQGKLWATDGTATGTGPVATPVQPCGGWTRLGPLVVYAGEEESRDCEPWVSDGTPRGTRLLRDIQPGSSSSYPDSFVTAGGFAYFGATDDRGHRQLWQTDCTPKGTRIVRALGTRGLGQVGVLGAAGSRVYFAANDGKHGVELWRSDGSPASTALVVDLSPGAADTYFFWYGGGKVLGSRLCFAASSSAASTAALWCTQGTAESTVRLTRPGLGVDAVLSVAGGRLYYAVSSYLEFGRELGVTDGTVEGTRVLDLARPVASSEPHQLIAGRAGLVFLAADGNQNVDLWRSGGHSWDTDLLADLVPGSNSDELRLEPGSGGAFYYTLYEYRFGWTDGQTVRDLLPPATVAYPAGFVSLGDQTLFFAGRWISATEWQPWIWRSDGTPEGTAPAAAAGLASSRFGFEFLATPVPDGSAARFLRRQADSSVSVMTFGATDGTAAGTRELVRLPVWRPLFLDRIVAAGRHVFVSFHHDARSALWASDGTDEGTREIYAINSELTAAGAQAFFLGDDIERGRELWASDGTLEGTRRVADLAPGAASSTPSDLAAFGDRVLFSADDGEHGRELWVSDGTEAGTRLLEIQPGPRGSYPQAFRVIGDRVIFAAEDGVHGLEPWVTDGTPEGTRLVADVMEGPLPSSPSDFTVYGGELFFNAGRPREGYELWKLPLEALEP